jgi:thiamine-phosphate pyrophosphorylase
MIDRENPILCYVTDRRSLPVGSPIGSSVAPAPLVEKAWFVEKIAVIAAAGVDWVQIREKDLSARELAALTRGAIARRAKARIIVNDRLDVALVEGAGGVHLGEAGLPVSAVASWRKRTAFGAIGDFLMGASCHSLEAAKAAVRDGADYVFFGPVFATPSKLKFGQPQGVKMLAAVCAAVAVPAIAIGGVTLENAGECISAGAAGVAAIRLFQDATDAAQIVSTLKKLRR